MLARSLIHLLAHSFARSLAFVALLISCSRSSFSSLPSLRRPTFAEKQDSRAVPRNEDEARKRERTPLFCKGEPLCGTRSDTRDTFSSLFFVHFIQDCGCQEEMKNRTGGRREEEKEEEGSRVWRKRIIPSCEISSCGVGRAVSDSSLSKRRGSEGASDRTAVGRSYRCKLSSPQLLPTYVGRGPLSYPLDSSLRSTNALPEHLRRHVLFSEPLSHGTIFLPQSLHRVR